MPSGHAAPIVLTEDERAESRRALARDVLGRSRTVNDTSAEREDTPAAATA